jgi:hypothetical protein
VRVVRVSVARYVVPFKELELATIIKARDASVQMLRDAIRARGKNPDAYVIRDILPKTDLGLTNEEWKIKYTSAYTWETMVNLTLPEDKFIALYGVAFKKGTTPKTLAIKFYKDVNPIAVIQVESLFAFDEMIGFFGPLVWGEAETLKVEIYGSAAGDDYVVLRGFVAELKRKTITG